VATSRWYGSNAALIEVGVCLHEFNVRFFSNIALTRSTTETDLTFSTFFSSATGSTGATTSATRGRRSKQAESVFRVTKKKRRDVFTFRSYDFWLDDGSFGFDNLFDGFFDWFERGLRLG
jgi:hypothetical protein